MNDSVEVQDDIIGFSLTVPKEWTVVSKEELAQSGSDPRTLFKFRLPTGQLIIVTYDGTCTEDQFDDAYKTNTGYMGEYGTVHNEQVIAYPDGRKVRRAFYDVKSPDGSIVRMCHDFTLVKNYFVDFNGGKMNSAISKDDLSGLMNDPIAAMLHELVSTIKSN